VAAGAITPTGHWEHGATYEAVSSETESLHHSRKIDEAGVTLLIISADTNECSSCEMAKK
jgi:hypothetical protein